MRDLQLDNVGGTSAEEGEQHEHAESKEVHGLATENVADFGVDDHEARVGDEVRGYDPVAEVKAVHGVGDGDQGGADDGGFERR